MHLLPYSLLGLIIGIVTGLLAFRADNLWLKVTGVAGGNAGFHYIFFYVVDKIKLPQEKLHEAISAFYLSLIISGFLSFFLCVYLLKKTQQNSPIKLKTVDILLARKDHIDKHYEFAQKSALKDENFTDMQEVQEQLQQNILREKQLDDRESRLNEQIASGALYVPLPENANITVSNRLIKSIPDFSDRIWNYSKYINQVSQQHADDIENKEHENELQKGEYTPFDIIRGYFLDVCIGTANLLFDSRDVRVHFRYLHNNKYIKLVSSMGGIEYQKELSPMNTDQGMIYKAGVLKRSLIKSLNLRSHQKAEHDTKWKNYITLVFDDYYDKGKPFLSMGISIKTDERHRHLLYFINYIAIEQMLQRAFNTFGEKINIRNELLGF
ncbi:hypothetical protein DSCW_43300 [Desulfosarcina widdelii]|uniref:Uncharacterized protein n=1 Tax=Desulfosarcina widdelii TaxID=947919 RepID=A0A5K7ZAU0_9BACT|nr:hypothetical protein [Desulfosarcina widdelii]BBO76913.1 hypothetical protein DSCW_43300 [Desulfosarcina widdelii]